MATVSGGSKSMHEGRFYNPNMSSGEGTTESANHAMQHIMGSEGNPILSPKSAGTNFMAKRKFI
jgi:hypothetical protein